jgi:riboflavin kinase/FMN adenylyltransferase
MNIFNSFDEIKFDINSIITLGTFDGVHRGHRVIINKLTELSDKSNLRPVLITIHPHPQIVLKKPGREPVKLLTTIEERIELFSKYGVNNVLIMPFSLQFSQTDARDFIIEYLYKQIGFKKILVGYDHLFGKNRSGDENLLQNLGEEFGFEVARINPYSDGDLVISSTKIRNALNEGNIETANEMLGYKYMVSGISIKGNQRGSSIGFATANIKIDDDNKLLPARGVYFVYSYISGIKYFGMANIGFRPTITEDKQLTLEVHYFGINREMYGETLTVNFLKFIRNEQKFESIDKLIVQLITDRDLCLNLINENTDN